MESEDLRKYFDHLGQELKLAISTTTHEVNNKLSLIMYSAEDIQEELAKDSPLQSEIQNIFKQIKSMSFMLEQIRVPYCQKNKGEVAQVSDFMEPCLLIFRKFCGKFSIRFSENILDSQTLVKINASKMAYIQLLAIIDFAKSLHLKNCDLQLSSHLDTDSYLIELSSKITESQEQEGLGYQLAKDQMNRFGAELDRKVEDETAKLIFRIPLAPSL